METTIDWGPYAPAVRRWEAVCGVAAPHPTEPNRNGRPRLSARFVEWLMGLAGPYSGWVTDLDISRAAKLRMLGNGVVPQQAAYAIRLLLADLIALNAEHEQAEGEPENLAA
jgi:DNA (cytosine-5)-methyltransferase 1